VRHLLVVLSVAGLLASVGCGGGGGGNSPGTTAGCSSTSLPLAQQLRNPVSKFAVDNNGVIISLPQVNAGGAGTTSGALIFGIGTSGNNGTTIGTVAATVLPIDTNCNLVGNTCANPVYTGIATRFNGVTYPNSTNAALSSVIDSGTSVLLFLDTTTTGIPNCGSAQNNYYCPNTPDALTAVNMGANSTPQVTTAFTVTDDRNLLTSKVALSDLAAPVSPGNPTGSTQQADGFFDWGLPFFYGRNVYTAIQGFTASGTAGPYFGYNGTVAAISPPPTAPNGAAAANVAPLIIDGGPVAGVIANNVAYTSVTICQPGSSSNCQTIDHIAVDTGSTGLRVLASALPSSLLSALPNVNPAAPVAACVQFLDQSFFWGSLRVADVKMGGPFNNAEVASSLPVHILGDPAFPTIPSSCSTVTTVSGTQTSGTEEDTVTQLGANGLIGLGPTQFDP